jgi:predicted ArsR family transcriptional regulator
MSSGKIDHTADGINSKDQADAVCGALYLASQFAEQFAYDYGESLNAALEVNESTSENYMRRQMITNFEQELTKAYANMQDDADDDNGFSTAAHNITQQEYQDIIDGIIVI